MSKIHFERFDKLLKFLPKSKIKAGDGLDNGKYPFFTSSTTLSKFIDTFNYEDESLIFGSGGNASIHYCNQKFATSTDCFVVNQDSEDIDVKYVYYYLKSNIKILEDGFKGAGLKHISKKYISEIKIPLLSLQDQQKIVQLLTQIEELIKKREKSIKLLDELIKSTFLDMFGDPVLNPRKLKKEKIKKFGKIVTGNTPPRKEEEYYNDNFIEWIKTDNIHSNKQYVTTASEYLSEKGMKKGRVLKKSGLLITCIAGSLKSIGNVAMTDRKITFNQQINAIQPFENIEPLFLYWLIKLNKNYIQTFATSSMKKIITKGEFQEIKFIKPPFKLQERFSQIAYKMTEMKEKENQKLKQLEDLHNSMMNKAFKGEIQ